MDLTSWHSIWGVNKHTINFSAGLSVLDTITDHEGKKASAGIKDTLR